MSSNNRKTLLEFYNHISGRGVSEGRCLKYLYGMKRITLILGKEYKEADKKDIERVLSTLRLGKENGKLYTANSMKDFKVAIKQFWQWLYDYPKSSGNKYPPIVDWFTCTVKKSDESKIEILTRDEVMKIIDSCDLLRDKAYLSVLWETAARPSEILNLSWGEIKPTSYHGLKFVVSGKTGVRKLVSIWSAKYLVRYMNSHPLREKAESDPTLPLWVGFRNYKTKKEKMYEPIDYRAVANAFQRAVEKAGIKKSKITLYTLRHTRLTDLMKRHTESVVKAIAGHTKGSNTLEKYNHLTDEDIEDDLLTDYDIIRAKSVESHEKLKSEMPDQCPVCKMTISPDEKFCPNCYSPLQKEAVLESRKVKDFVGEITSDERNVIKLITDPRFQRILKELKKNS